MLVNGDKVAIRCVGVIMLNVQREKDSFDIRSTTFLKSLRLYHDNFLVDFDPYHVEFFRKISNKSSIYEFAVKREVSRFYIDMFVRWNTKDKEVYKVTNMAGCVFLSNPLMNRLFYNFYKNLLVNETLFTCPIKRGQYYLRTQISKNVMPPIHPKGNFTFNVLIKNNTSNDGAMLDFRWMYRLQNGK
ncbi:hypothetical protein CVS40_3081 [Lucilia cuprina]|nr:hypothetical protein CVS40_3081 [Lucilia cuprina]